jgi:hypothetical protein
MTEIYPLQTAAASLFTRLTGRPGPRPSAAAIVVASSRVKTPAPKKVRKLALMDQVPQKLCPGRRAPPVNHSTLA